MKAQTLVNWGVKQLKKHNKNVSIAFLTMRYIDDKANMFLSNSNLTKKDISIYKAAIKTYCSQDLPIPFIFGYTFFYNLKIYVSKGCFLPRFETEQLVDELSYFLKTRGIYPKRIIDLCCGVGPIALSIKSEFSHSMVIGMDKNQKALSKAKETAKSLNLDVKFIHSDLGDFTSKIFYDVIIMNPPYISKTDFVDKSVLKNDPKDSLFAEDDGYQFYKLLADRINKFSTEKFIVCLEIGANQAKKVLTIMKKTINVIEEQVIKDYQQFDRIIIIKGRKKCLSAN